LRRLLGSHLAPSAYLIQTLDSPLLPSVRFVDEESCPLLFLADLSAADDPRCNGTKRYAGNAETDE